MRKNVLTGILLGIGAGLIDLIPMVIQGLTWDANLSAFLLWVVSGFVLATSNLQLTPVLKGIVISSLCLLPSLPIIGWDDPISLLPILIMTLILGSGLGFVYHKLAK